MTRPNVLLIVMDTARAQSALPAENPGVMPELEKFQREGVVFTDAITSAPYTLPSHASMFTGQYTSDHNTNAGSPHFAPDVTPLPKQLQKEGYETMAISNNTWISPAFGFDSGFEHFYQGWELLKNGIDPVKIIRNNDGRINQAKYIMENMSLTNWPATLLNTVYARFFHRRIDYGAKLTNFRIKHLLSRKRDKSRPFFLFINYLEPHLTYDPPKPYRYEHLPDDISKEKAENVPQRPWEYLCGNISMKDTDFRALEALYEGELSYLDYRIGRVFDFLRNEDLLDDTLVIVVGDHGENIGDHDLMDHQYCLYDTLLRVPLVVRYPKRIPAGRETDTLVELRDLYPTILDLCTGDFPSVDSVSSFSLLESEAVDSNANKKRERVFAEYLVPQPEIDQFKSRTSDPDKLEYLDSLNRSLRCIRTSKWKFISGSGGSKRLFNLENDAGEMTNVADENGDLVREFENQLQTMFGSIEVTNNNTLSEVDAGTRERLEDLGYI